MSKILAPVLIILLLCLQTLYSQSSFFEYTIDNNFNGPAGICVKDVDNNGFNDIIAAGYDASDICIWLHNGDNPVSWLKETIDSDFLGAIYAAAGDINGDSLIDVIGASWDSGQIVLWKNMGGHNPIHWEKTIIDSSSNGAHEVLIFDFENDGDLDIVSASAVDHVIALHLNNGGVPITWDKMILSDSFQGARSVCAGDIDNDNDNDIIGAALDDNEVALWRNEGGQPVVWTKFTISNNFSGAHKTCLYDLDGDNDLDILAAAYYLNQVAWWRNEGGNPIQWTKLIVSDNFTRAVISYPADIDLDNDVDVVGTAQNSNQVVWWRNESSNPIVWSKETIKYPFGGAWPLFIADLDNDFDQDIIAGAYLDDDIKWWENLHFKADFSGEPVSGNPPLEVHFIDNSNLNSGILTWEWDFQNDGIIDSYEREPVWTYDEEGTFTVFLRVSDSLSSDTEIKTNFINTVTVSVNDENPAGIFRLNQNYPNPFNPITTIKYSIPALSNVKLEIFNLLGEKISEIVNTVQMSGIYNVNWNAGNLSSGIYFCSLSVKSIEGWKNYNSIQKMILLK